MFVICPECNTGKFCPGAARSEEDLHGFFVNRLQRKEAANVRNQLPIVTKVED
jgi:hypothetical protein